MVMMMVVVMVVMMVVVIMMRKRMMIWKLMMATSLLLPSTLTAGLCISEVSPLVLKTQWNVRSVVGLEST